MPVRTATRTSGATRTATRTKKARTTAARKAPPAATAKKRTAAAPGLSRPVTPDAKLAAVVGSRPLPRTQVVKKVWDYVKAEGLQDQKDRRMINADDKLRPIFGGKRKVSMFEMTKMISAHVH
jgi:upstream activation factor subunit UAF30